MAKKVPGARKRGRTVAKGGFLGATPYELALATVDDRIYAELDREWRMTLPTAAPPKILPGGVPKTTAGVAPDAGSDWIDQVRSPFGRRKHMKLCRAGAFPSARKEGKKWLVPRSEIDAYIKEKGKPPPYDVATDIDRELEALGMIEPREPRKGES